MPIIMLMDDICLAVLKKIKDAGGGGYAVLSLDDLADGGVSAERTVEALKLLAAQKYVEIKYARGDMYCVAAVKEPYPAPIEEALPRQAEISAFEYAKPDKRFYILCAAFSFLGAFLGALIISAVFAAVG